MEKMSGSRKRPYLERFIKYNRHYQEFLNTNANLLSESEHYEEYQERKASKNRVCQRLYNETAMLLEQVKDPQARFIAELTFLDSFSMGEIANIFQLSEKRCRAILGRIYKDIQIDD